MSDVENKNEEVNEEKPSMVIWCRKANGPRELNGICEDAESCPQPFCEGKKKFW